MLVTGVELDTVVVIVDVGVENIVLFVVATLGDPKPAANELLPKIDDVSVLVDESGDANMFVGAGGASDVVVGEQIFNP